MRRINWLVPLAAFVIAQSLHAEEKDTGLSITDLDFMIGEWEIENRLFYHR